MMILITASALAAGQPATIPAPKPMPAGHDMQMSHEQHAAMKEKCCREQMGDKGPDMHAPQAEPHGEHGE